jgi:hypothetical protein
MANHFSREYFPWKNPATNGKAACHYFFWIFIFFFPVLITYIPGCKSLTSILMVLLIARGDRYKRFPYISVIATCSPTSTPDTFIKEVKGLG